MQTISAYLRRFITLTMAAALMLPTIALATERKMDVGARQEDLDVLYEGLRTVHPNLFANTPEEKFQSRKAEIEARLGTISEAEFWMDLQSLTALAMDSHTTLSLSSSDGFSFYPLSMIWRDGDWYLSTLPASEAEYLGQTVTAVNGRSMEGRIECRN